MFALYLQYEYYVAATQLVLTMLGVGVTLNLRHFQVLLQYPRSLLVGVGCQLILVPLLAFLLITLFPVDPGIAVGLVLIASVPGGSVSNIYTFLGLGNVALSISLTGLLTIAALMTTPLILSLMAAELMPPDFVMPLGRILGEIFALLLLPLSIGMVLGRSFPLQRDRISRWFIRGGIVALLAIVVGALGSGRIDVLAYGWSGPLTVIVFCVAIAILSRLSGKLARIPNEDAFAVGTEVTVRNANLALLLAVSMFPGLSMDGTSIGSGALFAILFYGGSMLLVALPGTIQHRRQVLRREATREQPAPQ